MRADEEAAVAAHVTAGMARELGATAARPNRRHTAAAFPCACIGLATDLRRLSRSLCGSQRSKKVFEPGSAGGLNQPPQPEVSYPAVPPYLYLSTKARVPAVHGIFRRHNRVAGLTMGVAAKRAAQPSSSPSPSPAAGKAKAPEDAADKKSSFLVTSPGFGRQLLANLAVMSAFASI